MSTTQYDYLWMHQFSTSLVDFFAPIDTQIVRNCAM